MKGNQFALSKYWAIFLPTGPSFLIRPAKHKKVCSQSI